MKKTQAAISGVWDGVCDFVQFSEQGEFNALLQQSIMFEYFKYARLLSGL